MRKSNSSIITLYIDKDFVDELKEKAKRDRTSLSAWIRLAALEKIRREDRERLDKPC